MLEAAITQKFYASPSFSLSTQIHAHTQPEFDEKAYWMTF